MNWVPTLQPEEEEDVCEICNGSGFVARFYTEEGMAPVWDGEDPCPVCSKTIKPEEDDDWREENIF